MIPKIVLERRANLAAEEVDGELVVLDRSANQVHRLNGTARFVWERFDGSRDLSAVVDEVCQTFEVERSQAAEDTVKLAISLLEQELVVEAGGCITWTIKQ
jgi:hypothetical protein